MSWLPSRLSITAVTAGCIQPDQPLDRLPEGLGARRPGRVQAGLAELVLVDVLADEERDAGPGELVVHHRVPHVALEPARGVGPDLADDVRLGIAGLDPVAELAPERVVVDLVGDVEPPAVDAEIDPLPADAPEELADLGAAGVELGQGRQAPPGLVVGLLVGVVGVERETR